VHSEIIAMLNSGMSFKRLLLPLLYGAAFIALCSFLLMNYVLPHSNIVRSLISSRSTTGLRLQESERGIGTQAGLPNVYIYMESYNSITQSDVTSAWKSLTIMAARVKDDRQYGQVGHHYQQMGGMVVSYKGD
jgi:lipopolysaccharide export LptBFGC system permease protein LptF